MMYLVELVEVFVTDPVEEVEENRFDEHAHVDLKNDSEEGRYFRRKADPGTFAVEIKHRW